MFPWLHENESCVLVQAPCSKWQLLFSWQQNQWNNMMCHPVLCSRTAGAMTCLYASLDSLSLFSPPLICLSSPLFDNEGCTSPASSSSVASAFHNRLHGLRDDSGIMMTSSSRSSSVAAKSFGRGGGGGGNGGSGGTGTPLNLCSHLAHCMLN